MHTTWLDAQATGAKIAVDGAALVINEEPMTAFGIRYYVP